MHHYCYGQFVQSRCRICQLRDNWTMLKQMPYELTRALKTTMIRIRVDDCVEHHYRHFTLLLQKG